MRILAFYHILMINHYVDIVLEQLQCITNSGLYDEVEKIYVGCLGRKYELEKLKYLVADYPKIEIAYYGEDVREYEFATLRILESKANTEEPFYGIYFHTKAVSWPKNRLQWAFTGGEHWRHYMNHYNLKKWKLCVEKLDDGFDTCGVKLCMPNDSPAYRLHYSGSFYWFKSEYIKKLPLISTLNLSDRFQAEFWIGSANAKAATLCQDFIDYKTKGVFNHG